MTVFRLVLAACALVSLGACAATDTAMRGVDLPLQAISAALVTDGQAPQHSGRGAPAEAAPYDVQRITVRVPETLVVSEANTYFPSADIVWREDPPGDRYAQVTAIVREAAERGAAAHDSGRPVLVDLQVTRFHALTEKTRYTIGGSHDIHFYMTVSDAKTGQVIEPPRPVAIEFEAYGGKRALEAVAQGQTQKVRIIDNLSALIEKELWVRSAPAQPPLALSAL